MTPNEKREVKIGDKFKLGPWTWKVTGRTNMAFGAGRDGDAIGIVWFDNEEAHKLDWIKPEPKCSKEFAGALAEWLYENDLIPKEKMTAARSWLTSHTEE